MFSRRAVGGGVLLVHNKIHYVPIGDGWEELLVRNVLHYVPVLHYAPITITYRAIKTTGTLIYINSYYTYGSYPPQYFLPPPSHPHPPCSTS
jgi:hypothetical protein